MPAFMSWGSFWNHPKMVTLSHQQRSILVLIGTEIRDLANMSLPEGFILNESITYMQGDYDEYQEVLSELEELGLVRRIDDPDGWQIERWLNVTGRFRAGVDETRWPCWGQKPLRLIMKQRDDDAKRQAKRIQSLKDAAKAKSSSESTEEEDQ